jgi:hypothetical protein
VTTPRRRRRHFSLNGLVIQVSAFALSFTLVALLVVGSSRAAFVEENESVTERPATQTSAPAPPAYEPQGSAPVAEEPDPTPEPTTKPTPARYPLPEPLPEPKPLLPDEVGLSDDAAGTAMFGGDGSGGVLVPGRPAERCIRVTFDGDTDAGPVLLYAAKAQGALARHLDLQIAIGRDGGSFGDCAGFTPTRTVFTGTLERFGADHAAYDSGLVTWDPAASGEALSFRFTLTVRDDPAAEGLSASFGFTWETRG